MFIDGRLVNEGHTLGEGNSFFFLLEAAEKYGFKRADVRTATLNKTDDNTLMDAGSFPKTLFELTGVY